MKGRKMSGKEVLGTLFWVLITFIAVLLGPQAIDSDISDIPLLAIIGGLVGIYYLIILVHEGGHWLAGLLAGFRTVRLSVGPFMFLLVNGRPQFRFVASPASIGGLCWMVCDNEHSLERRQAVFAVGGPLASLTSGALAVALAQTLTGGWLRVGLITYGCLSILVGLYSLLPRQYGAFSSDGRQLLTLLRGGEDARRLVAILRLGALFYSGVGPRDWPREAVESLGKIELATSQRTTIHSLQFVYFRDRGEIDEAREVLERELDALQHEKSQIQPNWHLDAAAFYAQFEQDAEKARCFFLTGDGAIFVDESVKHMIEAEVLLAERRLTDAKQSYQRAVNAEASVVYLPSGYPLAEKLADLKRRLETASKEAASPENAALSSEPLPTATN